MNNDARLAAIDRKLMLVGLYNLPGVFAVAGGLLGKFGEPDEIPFAFLTNSTTTTLLLVFGVASLLWFGVSIFKLSHAKLRLQSDRAD